MTATIGGMLHRALTGGAQYAHHAASRIVRARCLYSTDPTSLMTDLSRRIAHLEEQLRRLHTSQAQLASLQSFLQLGETFKRLHRHLTRLLETKQDLAEDRRVRRLLARYHLTPAELERTLVVCKSRNALAHPQGIPDLTQVDPDIARIFDKVHRLLSDLDRPAPSVPS